MYDLFNRSALIVQRYGGTVDKFTGDGLMALFGAPVALEDHALRAAFAALEIETAAAQLAETVHKQYNIDLQIRIGLNSGAVITGDIGSSYTAIGHPVGMAQRMEAAAPPGGTLCSESTATLIEHTATLGPLEFVGVKNESEPVPARRLDAINTDQVLLGRRGGVMHDRDDELDLLTTQFDRTAGAVLAVTGAPGLGKTRLIGEFVTAVTAAGCDVIIAGCEAHTADVPLRVLSRVLRAMFGIARLDADTARGQIETQLGAVLAPGIDHARALLELLGLAVIDPAAPELSTDSRRRRLVEVMVMYVKARDRRAVLIVEDVHWIDAASEQVLAEFAEQLATSSSTLAFTYRPEYSGRLRTAATTTVNLKPLADSSATALITELLGDDPRLRRVADLIAVSAAGNPFFVEEIIRDLAARGVLTGSRGAYRPTGDLVDVTVPATVQAVIAARIDRLTSSAKSLLNAAAVIGSRFEYDTLRVLTPDADAEHLGEIVSAELIDQIEFVPQPRYEFRHPLIRTVAYESQLAATRSDSHRRFAHALESMAPDRADENAALIATHLEAAGDCAAYGWHMRAANWLQSKDVLAARSSWKRGLDAADCLPADEPFVNEMRTAPRVMLALTNWQVDGFDPHADRYFAELVDLTAQTGDTLSAAAGIAGQVLSMSTNDDRILEAAELVPRVLAAIEAVEGHEHEKAGILAGVMWVQFLAGDLASALSTISSQRAMPPPNRTVNGWFARSKLIKGMIAMLLGDQHQGRRNIEEGLNMARSTDPAAYANCTSYAAALVAAGLNAADGALLRHSADALRVAEDSGDDFAILSAQWARGTILFRAGDEHRATGVDLLTRANEAIRAKRMSTMNLASSEPDLAVEAARQGRRDEAIGRLHDVFWRQANDRRGSPLMIGFSAAPLVELLLQRNANGDTAEAKGVLTALRAVLDKIEVPAILPFQLKCEALIAKAGGDRSGFAAAAQELLEMSVHLDAPGWLDDAHRLVDEASASSADH